MEPRLPMPYSVLTSSCHVRRAREKPYSDGIEFLGELPRKSFRGADNAPKENSRLHIHRSPKRNDGSNSAACPIHASAISDAAAPPRLVVQELEVVCANRLFQFDRPRRAVQRVHRLFCF